MNFSIYLEQELSENLKSIFDKSFDVSDLRFKQKQELLKKTRSVLKREGKEDDYIKRILQNKERKNN